MQITTWAVQRQHAWEHDMNHEVLIGSEDGAKYWLIVILILCCIKPSIYRLLTLTKLNFFGDQLDA